MWLGIRLIGLTPDQYANFPVYVSRNSHYCSSLFNHAICVVADPRLT
jgi:hypothetical protein